MPVGEGEFHSGSGEVTFYDQNGHPMRTTHYENNLKNGPETYFTPSGEVFRTIVFKDDRIVSQETDSTLLK